MDTDRPQHRSTSNSSSATSTSELFICFTSRLSSSSSMKITSKSILSPGRARDSSQISLSTSLSRRLRSSGSTKGGQASPMFPPTNGKKRGCSFENTEPSSPKVTCIGQVRVKTKKQGKKIRAARSKSRREVGFRRTEQGSGTSNLQDATHLQDYGQMGHSFQQQECLPHTHRNQRWVHLPITICEALRAFGAEFNCFLPCRSSCMASNSQREKEEKATTGGNNDNNGGGSSSSCGAVFARWLMAEKIELVVGEEEEAEEEDEMPRRSQRRHVLEDIVIGDTEKFGDNKNEILEEEEARVSICIPPKNALLLMRCRSDPVKMAALANRFWECPPPQDEAEDENQNQNQQVNEELESVNESRHGNDGQVEVEVEQQMEQAKQVFFCENNLVSEEDKVPDAESEVKAETLVLDREEKEQESQEFAEVEESSEKQEEDENVDVGTSVLEASSDPENEANAAELLQQNENEVALEDEDEDEPQPEPPQAEEAKDVIFDAIEESRPRLSGSSVECVQREQEYDEEVGREQEAIVAEESAEEKETLEKILQDEEEGKQATVTTTRERTEPNDPEVAHEPETGQESKERESQNHQQQQQNLLPDCLLLMMCEPKLSMEVSKETWVCSTDFIRWLPHERKPPSQNVNKGDGSDEPKKQVSIDSNPAQQQQKQQQLMQPPRSSCSFPLVSPLPPAYGAASMNSMVEQKLVGAKPSYEPFVLTRCKSEPMRSSTKLATEACFWKNRKLEPHRPATLGVGAAGVGF